MKTINYPLKEKQWIATPVRKTHIVWHGTGQRTSNTSTAGIDPVANMIDNWNYDGEKYAMPYVISRSGAVYETFPDDHWAYHVSALKSNGFNDKRSIGIEMANELGLLKVNDKYFAFGSTHHQNEYLGPVHECDFRGYKYWADFAEPQIDALLKLTLELCAKHNIEPIYYPYRIYDPGVWNKVTILRHCNVFEKGLDFPAAKWINNKIKAAGISIYKELT